MIVYWYRCFPPRVFRQLIIFIYAGWIYISHSDAFAETYSNQTKDKLPKSHLGYEINSHQKVSSRTEIGALPVIGYDSDRGLGLGAILVLARLSDHTHPFDWRIQLLAYTTTQINTDSEINFPLHRYYLGLDIPEFINPKFRLVANISFQKLSNAGYYGIGSRSRRLTSQDGVSDRYHQYDRIYPGFDIAIRRQLYDKPTLRGKRRLELFGGTRLTYNNITVYDNSALAYDLATKHQPNQDGTTLQKFLFGTSEHLLWNLTTGLLWDTRDHEFAPSRGTFSELSLRFSPGIQTSLLYGGLTGSTTWYFPIYRDQWVLGARLMGDILLGDIPFYELTSLGTFEPLDGPGGARSVRSILRQRYAGKVKLLANAELRGQAFRVQWANQKFRVGTVLFADAGRVWSDFSTQHLRGVPLDKPFFDFSVGLGGGLRIQWGETFIIRADYAYSPTDSTTGLYIDVGQAF